MLNTIYYTPLLLGLSNYLDLDVDVEDVDDVEH